MFRDCIGLVMFLFIVITKIFFIEVSLAGRQVFMAQESVHSDERDHSDGEFQHVSDQESSDSNQRLLSIVSNHHDIQTDDQEDSEKDRSNESGHK